MHADLRLGSAPTADLPSRDAVHVAVFQAVVADEYVVPCQRVALVPGTIDQITSDVDDKPVVGVVDPFLPDDVPVGSRVWVFVLPNTVIGMVHRWTHPLFPEPRCGFTT